MHVTASADLLEYYRDLGYDMGVWMARTESTEAELKRTLREIKAVRYLGFYCI